MFYMVFFSGISQAGNLFSIQQDVIVVFLFPLSGLYILYWGALMLEVFSMSIDVKLAGRKFDFNSMWNLKVRKYFISYLKRNGVTLNEQLVKDIVFLPGENKGVVCYGGRLSRPRITIEKDLLKFALGDIDESNFEELEEHTQKAVEPVLRQTSAFQIVANLSQRSKKKKLFQSRYEKKRIKILEKMQTFFERDLNLQRSQYNHQTEDVMHGVVFPRLEGGGDFPSLMSDNLDDMQVFEEILLECSMDKYRYDDDAEVDDSSEQDKDFLFGALLHKFGGLLRHEDIFSTIYLYLPRRKKAKKRSYNFPFSKYFSVVADTFVVLNFGLSHLMQYLYHQATNSSSHLTKKGITSRMLNSQDEILTGTKEVIDEREPRLILTDELDRITWLSRFCHGSIERPVPATMLAKKVFKLSFFLGATAMAFMVLINSYNYHPKYRAIIDQEEQEIADAIKNEQDKEEKET
jgi:hypothetical protein